MEKAGLRRELFQMQKSSKEHIGIETGGVILRHENGCILKAGNGHSHIFRSLLWD
jgi:hypothetical protein